MGQFLKDSQTEGHSNIESNLNKWISAKEFRHNIRQEHKQKAKHLTNSFGLTVNQQQEISSWI